jgi:hypothetical protein
VGSKSSSDFLVSPAPSCRSTGYVLQTSDPARSDSSFNRIRGITNPYACCVSVCAKQGGSYTGHTRMQSVKGLFQKEMCVCKRRP